MRELKNGENNPRWLGGLSFKPYGPKFTKSLRREIRKRDKYICQYGGGIGKTIHHIDYNKDNNKKSNLITLCSKCHSKTNNNRKYWKYLFKNIIQSRYS